MAMPTGGIRIVGYDMMRVVPELWQLERMLAGGDRYSNTEIHQVAIRALALLPQDRGLRPLRVAIGKLASELSHAE